MENPGPGPGPGRDGPDPGPGRDLHFVPVPVPVPAGIKVIPARSRPGWNFCPGRPLIYIYTYHRSLAGRILISLAHASDIKIYPSRALAREGYIFVEHAGLEEPECYTKFIPRGEDDIVYIHDRELFE